MENQFKQIAALIGDPTRATIMWTLLDGRAFSASELAIAADTTPQNISMHLAKLVQADMLRVQSQGRHRYYTFAHKEVAYAIEAMANLLPQPTTGNNSIEEIPAIKYCRTCYDHLAGKAGVAVTDSLLQQKIIVYKKDEFQLTPKGKKWFAALDIDTDILQQQRRSFIRPCLDWTERRHHMAGSLAAALLDIMLTGEWIRRTKNSRVIVITAKGQKKLQEHFGISL